MSLEDSDWTAFILEAENEAFGLFRIARVHTALRARLATAEADGKAASRYCYLAGWNDVAHDRGCDFNRAWAAWLASEESA